MFSGQEKLHCNRWPQGVKGSTRSTPSVHDAGLDTTWVKQWAIDCDFKNDDIKKVLASLRMRQSTPDACKCRTALRMAVANGMSARQACALFESN